MLSTNLEPRNSRDRATLDVLLNSLVSTLNLSSCEAQQQDSVDPTSENGSESDSDSCHKKSNEREVQLLVMYLLSVLMSRSKTAASTTAGGAGVNTPSAGAAAMLPQVTANCLVKAGALTHCLSLLQQLLSYWKQESQDTAGTIIGAVLLKPRPLQPLPDMSPFFVRPSSKSSQNHDVFNNFPHLLTEMVLRLPYQASHFVLIIVTFNLFYIQTIQF